jgi:hypothetical protein
LLAAAAWAGKLHITRGREEKEILEMKKTKTKEVTTQQL